MATTVSIPKSSTRRFAAGLTDATLRRLLLVNLVAQVAIVVTGGLVRLTGSGLGCPTWPQCVEGSYTPVVHQAEGYHKYIEFGNRTLTGVLTVTAILAFLAAREMARRGVDRRIVGWAAAVIGGVVFQAVLGGITVRTGLNPWTVAGHFLASMVLVAAATFTYDLSSDSTRSATTPSPTVRLLARLLAVVGTVVLVLGTVVTGSGPHSGDADTPARTGIDPRMISWLHADAVMLFIGLAIGLLVAARAAEDTLIRGRAAHLLGLTCAQGIVGYVQYATKLPMLLVLVHMLFASLLVVAIVRVNTAVRSPAPALAPAVA